MLGHLPALVHGSGHVASCAWPTEQATFATEQAMLFKIPHHCKMTERVGPEGLLRGTGMAAAILMVALRSKGSRRKCRRHAMHAADDDEADVLMRAGLRNLLGVEDNKLAQKLQVACQLADDNETCLKDSEVKTQVAEEELTLMVSERDTLQTTLTATIQQLEEANQQWSKEQHIEEKVEGLRKDLGNIDISSLEEKLQIEKKTRFKA